jgi:hypothetical protein
MIDFCSWNCLFFPNRWFFFLVSCSCWRFPVEEHENLCWGAWWCNYSLGSIWIAWISFNNFSLLFINIFSGCSFPVVQYIQFLEQVRIFRYSLCHFGFGDVLFFLMVLIFKFFCVLDPRLKSLKLCFLSNVFVKLPPCWELKSTEDLLSCVILHLGEIWRRFLL